MTNPAAPTIAPTIAVVMIARDEAARIGRAVASALEPAGPADLVLVADTGSADATCAVAAAAGASVHHIRITPWRFDDARNAAQALVPVWVDWIVSIDADEVLQPGWRAAMEAAITAHPDATKLRYSYVWSWRARADGTEEPAVLFDADKIHRRAGYRWINPCHETIRPVPGLVEHVVRAEGLELHHHPDDAKSRGQYLPLLELAAAEAPHCDRTAHYLGREYLNAGRHAEAEAALTRHLALPSAVWEPERSASMRYLARCAQARGDGAGTLRWLLRAAAEAPALREPWIDLATVHAGRDEPLPALYYARQALTVTERGAHYMTEPDAWGWKPHQLAAAAAIRLGLHEEARAQAAAALAHDPERTELQHLLTVTTALAEGKLRIVQVGPAESEIATPETAETVTEAA